MPRRAYSKAEVYDDEVLVATDARVIHDSLKGKVEVKVSGADTVTFEVVDGPNIARHGREQVITWALVSGRTLTAIKQGCGCGK